MHIPHLLLTTLVLPTSLRLAAFVSAKEEEEDQDSTASVEYTSDSAFKEAILDVTNTYRKQHNATSLRWNETLVEYAEEVSEGCVFEHSGGPYGENLASGYLNTTDSLKAWGHERVDYDFDDGDFSEETGHFTQLVWKSTTDVGCARTKCNSDSAPGWYLVCEYSPTGNVLGNFTQNVQPGLPQDEQPEDGPDDPEVPEPGQDDEEGEGGEEDCPQGAVCDEGVRGVRQNMGALWVAVAVACMGSIWGL